MSDLISREQAIDALERAKQNIRHNIERAIGRAICEILDEVENGIKQLPPIQPKKGRWIKNETTWTGYKCSVCGDVPYMHTCMGKPMYNYCPYCGSDMREVNHEID